MKVWSPMIENEKQYKMTQGKLRMFEGSLAQLIEVIEKLKEELKQYEEKAS